MYALFNRFEIKMTMSQAHIGSHQGACDDDVAYLLTLPAIKPELKRIPDDALIAELREYGAWNDEELSDRAANESRIVWIAAGNIVEESRRKSR